MSQTNDVGANIDLSASFLPTSNYLKKRWRISYYTLILISLKKSTTASESPPSPSSAPYSPLPSSEPPAPARSSSSRSSVAIDIDPDPEEEKEEDVEPGGVDRVRSDLGQQPQDSEDGTLDSGNRRVIPVHGTSFSRFILDSCKRNSYTISMLLFSAALSFATGFKQEGARYGWHDGVAIVIAVILLVTFPSITNFWRERKMMKLSKMMQSSMSCDTERRGLLEERIEKPVSYADKFALFVSALVALVALLRLICKKNGDSGELPDIKGKVPVGSVMEVLERTFLRPQGRISILTGLVTVAILCVQHGMPLMVAISLSYQIDKVSSQDAVLKDLSACTTMGLVTVICIDASGGLTSKTMEVSRIWMGEKDISKVEGSEVDQVVLDVLQQGVGLSVLAPELPLSPMSSSLASWAETTWGMNMKSFKEEFDILKHSKLNSDEEGCGVLVRKVGDNERVLHLHWSGAASTVLDMCSLYYDSKGERHAMENQKINFGKMIEEMEGSGLKPIAFAHKQTMVQELEHDGLILLGLIGLKHTCQESTKLALEYLRNAGIQIKLVSEDNIMVVKDIACELGVEVPVDGIVLEGQELQDLNGSARLDKVDPAIIMGSLSHEDKSLIVQCLQEKGHVVAFVGRRMTTSHASVLQVADVGIVHNSLGTILSKESPGVTVKCFSALKPIVRAGRSNYNNIQKFVQLQLIFSISGSLITLITTMSTGGSPLTAFQLIWVNVLMCLLGGLMMVMELSSEEQLGIRPSDRNQSIITKDIWKSIVVQVLYQISASMILEFGGHITDIEKEVRKTMIFNTFLLCQVFNLLNTMHLLKKEFLKVVLQSYCFVVALALCFLMQVLVIEYAKCLAHCMRLNAPQWGICILVGILSWVFECALKIIPVILSTNHASESNASPPWIL